MARYPGYAIWCLCFVISYLIFPVELLNLLHKIRVNNLVYSAVRVEDFKLPKNCFHTHWLDLCNIYFIRLYNHMKIMPTVTCTMVPTYKYCLHYECQYFVFINFFYFFAFICCYLCLFVLCVLDMFFLSFPLIQLKPFMKCVSQLDG